MLLRSLLTKIMKSLRSFEFRRIQQRASYYGYELTSTNLTRIEGEILENVFQTGYSNNALLSYLIYPFLAPLENIHSNHQECFAIAESLKELGYNVDVMNWDNESYLPKKKYHLVIDNHDNLFRLSNYFINDTLRVFHATNAHWLYQNAIEYGRHQEFFEKTGISIAPPRIIPRGDSAAYCDVITMFGNSFTTNTYKAFREKVRYLPMSVTAKPASYERTVLTARKHFIWLNSHGALLKGLDVVLEAFMECPDLILSVCGNLEKDHEFFDALSERLSNAINIRLLGWVDIDSLEFEQLASSAAWVVSASFSEGGGGSILNCMAKGLVPIISRSSSITLPADCGFYLSQNEPTALREIIKKASELPTGEIETMSRNACEFIRSNHMLGNFKSKFKELIVDLETGSFKNKNNTEALC